MTADKKTAHRIADALLEAGLRRGAVVLVHASLSKLGWVEGGAETVIDGLGAAAGDDGTLLLPGFSFATVGFANPTFSVRETPSCVGIIPECFRVRYAQIRSVHPTHSVCAAGRLAMDICKDHQLDNTPVGEHSPLRKLRELDGQVVFLACGLAPNTSMHGVEELVRPPYLLREYITYRIILADGSEIRLRHRHHDFRGWRQRYDRLEHYLLPGSEIKVGRVLEGTAHIIEARALWSRALEQYRKDPFAFVEPLTLPSQH